MNKYENILKRQRNYLSSIGIIDVTDRIENLKKLKNSIKKYENNIINALNILLLKQEF